MNIQVHLLFPPFLFICCFKVIYTGVIGLFPIISLTIYYFIRLISHSAIVVKSIIDKTIVNVALNFKNDK